MIEVQPKNRRPEDHRSPRLVWVVFEDKHEVLEVPTREEAEAYAIARARRVAEQERDAAIARAEELRAVLQDLYDDWQGPLTEAVKNAQAVLLAATDGGEAGMPDVASALAVSFIERSVAAGNEIEIMRGAACSHCAGTGRVGDEVCSCCNGSGREQSP